MRFLVVGAGAIGAYVGGCLAAAGHPVAFLARRHTADVIATEGLVIERGERSLHVQNVAVFTDAGEALRTQGTDVVICALKSFDTESALADLVSTGEPLPPVLSLQNGVDNEPLIGSRIGPDRVIAGTVTTAVSVRRAGRVVEERHRGVGIALGHPLAREIAAALDEAGLSVQTFSAAGPMKWSKLLGNLAGNATSAITDLSVGEVYADPGLFRVELAQLRECLAVMGALRHDPVDLPGLPMRALARAARDLPVEQAQPLLLQALASGRGAKMPSLHIDLHSGRGRTEVGYLHGAVARHAALAGVPTPVCTVLAQTLEALSAGTADIERFRRQPAQLVSLMPPGSLPPHQP
ncbi:MAG: 2-dehydropantoate 2-reductase [Tetrasphaera sp.]